jgi:UDP-glucose 4-epimerase
MRIFVTGGAGYIGSVFVEEAVKAGHEVTVYDNLSEGHRAAVDPKATLIVGDLLDRPALFAAAKQAAPEAVVHFAGRALVPESMKNPSIYYQVNVTGGINLLDAMLEAGCKRIVFSSTCATYGIPEKIPIDERCPQKPINPYGHSKLMFEQILKWYETVHGIVFVALRYFNACGASEKLGEHHRIESHLIPNILKVALKQSEFVSVFGDKYATPDGTCIRDYIHIKDLAAAHLVAVAAGHSGAYNLGTGEGYSVLQVIEACKKATGQDIPFKIMPGREGDPARLVASPHRAKAELGWKASYTKIGDIVSSAWQWHVKNPEGYKD